MSREVRRSGRRSKQQQVRIVVDNFKGGLVTLVDQAIAPLTSVIQAKNMMQVQDGRWSTRWGTQYYGADLGGTVEGIERYVASDMTSHLVAVVDTGATSVIKRSLDDGATWTTCTGATRTNGYQPYFMQSNSVLYMANSKDDVIRYDGSTTLLTYTALTTPTGLALTKGSGLTTGTYQMYYRVSAINDIGETLACTEVAATSGINIDRDNWKNDPTAADTQYIDLVFNRVTNAKRYNIYASSRTGEELYLDSIADPNTGTTVSYHDNGKASLSTYISVPSQNSTLGPKFGPMEMSGNRLWATKDLDNPWRVWWSGTFPNMGAFNPYYDGGYIDLELGGAERPQRAIHYRDGKGGSFITVLTSDPEGNGSIWQIDLQTVAVGNFSYTLPVPTKIVGSVGTTAPLSVVKVKNDIMFLNRKGVFTLGSKAQMLNLLSTTEISSNIRPDIRAITGSAIHKAAGIYYDAKVFYSVPYGNSDNNYVYVNDTERLNWSGPWTFGVRQFLVYSDTDGDNHLLGVPTNGSRLIEIAEGIPGDLGVAFETSLITGLIPVNPRDRTQFAKISRAYLEMSHPLGHINFTVLGTDRKGQYSANATFTLTGALSTAGYGTEEFSSAMFSDTSVSPLATSDVIVWKYKKVRKRVNNVQFKISTTEIGASYTLLSLMAKGDIVNGRDPSGWKS